VDHPYLNTIGSGSTREYYADDKAPAISMAAGFTKINIGGAVVMIIHVKSYYQFRGRRMNTSELPGQ